MKEFKWITEPLWWINVLLAGGMLLSLGSRFIAPDDWWPASVMSLGFNLLLLANLPFLLIWPWMKPIRTLLPALVCIPSIAMAGWGFSFSKEAQLGKHRFTVGIVNCGNFSGGKEWMRREGLRASVMQSVGADIVLLPESRINRIQAFTSDSLLASLGYNHLAFVRALAGNGTKKEKVQVGLLFASKFRIIKWEAIKFQSEPITANSGVQADIDVHGEIIRILAFHLESNRLVPENHSDPKTESLKWFRKWKHDFTRKYRPAVQDRARQARFIAELIKKSPHPVVVIGDFNDPPTSYVYQTISAGLNDAFIDNCMGIGSTYNGKLPMLRIDNILYGKGLQPNGFRIIPSPLSDHFPVVASFGID